jgi:hypothetical protein
VDGEATRRVLTEGRITLSPTPDHTAVTGPVQLVGLGEHMLELAGWQRKLRGLAACKPSGSGGVIANGGLPAIPLRRKAS